MKHHHPCGHSRHQPTPSPTPSPTPAVGLRAWLRLRWLLPLAVVLLPPLVWGLLLSVAPTDWARQRLAHRMSELTGRSVRLATVRVGICGGIYLTGLEIGAPGAVSDPWLKVARAYLNISPLQLICGHVEPTETVIEGITLRVLRRADGSLELGDLIHTPAARSPAHPGTHETTSGPCTCPLSRLDLRIRGGEVSVIDAPTRTRLDFHDVTGHAILEGRNATIPQLQGSLSGGNFEVAAQLDRSTPRPSFEGHLRAQGIALNQGMTALGYLVPVLASPTGALDGTLELNLYVRGHGNSRAELRQAVIGHGTVKLDPIQLEQSRFLNELASIIELPSQHRVGSITSDFKIKQGKIISDNLTIDLSKLPIVLTGWTDFDGAVNYRLKGEGLVDRLPNRARDLLADLAVDTRDLAQVKIEGDIDAPDLTIGGVPLIHSLSGRGEAAPGAGDDRQRLRELGRRLRDRILR